MITRKRPTVMVQVYNSRVRDIIIKFSSILKMMGVCIISLIFHSDQVITASELGGAGGGSSMPPVTTGPTSSARRGGSFSSSSSSPRQSHSDPLMYSKAIRQQQPPPQQQDIEEDMNTAPPQQNRRSFEDAAAEWRRDQYQKSQQRAAAALQNNDYQSSAPASSPSVRTTTRNKMFNNDGQQQPTTDEEGRLSLLAQVSRTSLCFWFFVLMWRAIHHYELADAYRRHSSFSSLSLFVLIIPTATLFLLNMAGCVASFTSPKHKTKKRLKAILNVNKLVEVVLFIYNLGRMTIVPPLFTTSKKFVPKEVYVARLVHNVLYVIASQAFTRVTWDATHEMSSTVPSSSYGGGGYGEGIGYDSGYGYGYNDDNDYGGGSAVEDFQGGARRRRQRDIGSTASYPSSHQPYFSTGGYADYGAQDSRNRMYDNENQE